MARVIDRVPQDDILEKSRSIGDLVMHAARKSGMTPEELQQIIERGGELQQAILPILWRLSMRVQLVDSALLKPIGISSVPAVKSFSAKTKFRHSEVTDGVKIFTGSNFDRWFLNGDGKIETDVPAHDLRIHGLRQGSVDDPIIRELGGEGIVETHLATVWEMLKRQPNGEEIENGLLVNGWWNIFYVRDAGGDLRAVRCPMVLRRPGLVSRCRPGCVPGRVVRG